MKGLPGPREPLLARWREFEYGYSLEPGDLEVFA